MSGMSRHMFGDITAENRPERTSGPLTAIPFLIAMFPQMVSRIGGRCEPFIAFGPIAAILAILVLDVHQPISGQTVSISGHVMTSCPLALETGPTDRYSLSTFRSISFLICVWNAFNVFSTTLQPSQSQK